MTADAASAPGATTRHPQRRRPGALILACAVLAAGVAGTVVTSSAYFTDTKTIASSTVSTSSVRLAVNEAGGTTAFATGWIANGLVPLQAADLDANAPAKAFDIKNDGAAAFTWKITFANVEYKKADGTALNPPTTVSAASAAQKVMYQFGTVSGGTTTWGTAASMKSATDAPTAAVIASSANLASGAVQGLKMRFYLDSSVDNTYQDLQLKFDLKVDAEQAH